MKRLLATGLVGALLLSGAGCSDNAAKDKDPSVKAGTTLGSKDLKQAKPNSGGDKGGAGGKAMGE
jgi:hypothetical protein